MGAANPYDNPELYDVIVLGGQQSPGVCKLNAPTRDHGWEKSEPAGSDGGEVVNKGKKLMEFDVVLTLWKEPGGVDHFDRWETWKQILKTPVAKNAPKALDIYHPQLDGLDIKSVVAKSWNEPQPIGGGKSTVTIKFLEYSPAKKKPAGSGKPKAAANLVFTLAGPMTQEQLNAFQAQEGFDPRDLNGFAQKGGGGSGGPTSPPQAPTQDPAPDPNQDLLDELEAERQRSADLEAA